jgi:hypothetical protein
MLCSIFSLTYPCNRLAKRAKPGENFLYLQDAVNWQADQKIVLVTTSMRDSRDWHQNEVFTILSVDNANVPRSEVKAIVYLDGIIENDHIARPEYQAEVGLLTRTITIQGSVADSPPADSASSTCQLYNDNNDATSAFGYDQVVCPDKYLTGYGGHIMVHSGGVGYVEGVELYRMGQTNVVGRYPMHFHVLGNDCPGCYLKDSSIHESYYRCISIHGTNGVTVSENVAFDVTGFCYYLEDGVEEDLLLPRGRSRGGKHLLIQSCLPFALYWVSSGRSWSTGKCSERILGANTPC